MNELEQKILDKVNEKFLNGDETIIFNSSGGNKATSIGFHNLSFTKNGNGCFVSTNLNNYFISQELYNLVNELIISDIDYSELEKDLDDI